jgi:hypothetical protein
VRRQRGARWGEHRADATTAHDGLEENARARRAPIYSLSLDAREATPDELRAYERAIRERLAADERRGAA